jgi:transposase
MGQKGGVGAIAVVGVGCPGLGIPDGGRQHRPRSPARRGKKNTQDQEAMGKSRGGLSTKIHAAVDGLGNPVRLLLTAGQVSEHTQAEALIAGFRADFVLADKGYDSDAFVETIKASGATPVIPPKSNRKTPRDYDKEIYKGTQPRGTLVPKTERIPPCRHPVRTAGGQLYDYAEFSQRVDLA